MKAQRLLACEGTGGAILCSSGEPLNCQLADPERLHWISLWRTAAVRWIPIESRGTHLSLHESSCSKKGSATISTEGEWIRAVASITRRHSAPETVRSGLSRSGSCRDSARARARSVDQKDGELVPCFVIHDALVEFVIFRKRSYTGMRILSERTHAESEPQASCGTSHESSSFPEPSNLDTGWICIQGYRYRGNKSAFPDFPGLIPRRSFPGKSRSVGVL